jgi:hypothetical protein
MAIRDSGCDRRFRQWRSCKLRILQVTLFGALQSNLGFLEFSLLLPDVMTIADEVDAQLTQSMQSYMNEMQRAVA